MLTIREETPADVAAREALLDAAMGGDRRLKASERLREGNAPARGLALSATDAEGRLLGSLRLWPVVAGSAGEGLLLGPLAVAPAAQGAGVGSALMQAALRRAENDGWRFVLLVGDVPYYGRFGFGRAPEGLVMPGAVDPARFLARAFAPGSLAGAEGGVTRPALRRRARQLGPAPRVRAA